MKRLLLPLYWLKRQLWRLLRLRSRGVKVMVFNAAGELLLIRNTYGRTDLFVLPGGGIHLFEKPAAAAAREVTEELDCDLEGLAFVATHISAIEGKRDVIHLYRARAAGPFRADGFEVAEARYFALDALPESVSPATVRRIQEYRGERAVSEAW